MNKVTRFEKNDFADMVSITAREMGLREAIIEKDFWVCAVLDYLFHKCEWKNAFTFKGGTSLSKVYGLIKRFSEDIDIILDWREIGYDIDEPWEDRSKSKQDKFNKEANIKTKVFLEKNYCRA
jgi:predicted nucleotidyltransferase component of viral defense system